jgi:hypothetical protein
MADQLTPPSVLRLEPIQEGLPPSYSSAVSKQDEAEMQTTLAWSPFTSFHDVLTIDEPALHEAPLLVLRVVRK